LEFMMILVTKDNPKPWIGKKFELEKTVTAVLRVVSNVKWYKSESSQWICPLD
jgi:hypothetical protein